MTCKDAINSDTNSEDKKVYLLEKSRSYNKCFRFSLEGTTDQNVKLAHYGEFNKNLNSEYSISYYGIHTQ
jgi:hypothetical protein